MSRRIFVTGGSGFNGRHVLDALRRADLTPVALVSRPNPELGRRFPGLEMVVGDLLDAEALDAGLQGASAVVHLAAKNIDRDGTGFQRVNVEGSRLLAGRAAAAGVERLIYLSSVGVYGHGAHRLADETTPVQPDTPFSRSKAAAEEIFLEHHGRRRQRSLDHDPGGFEAVILRHRFVYGDGDVAVLPRLIGAARKYSFWISGGRAAMSLIWAADLASIIARLAAGEGQVAGDGPIYHVTDGRPITYREVITTLCRTFGWKPPRISVPLPVLYWPVRLRERLLGIDPEVSQSSITSIRLALVAQDNSFSNAKLQRLLPDLKPATFEQGLAASLEHYRRFAEPRQGKADG